MRRDGVWGDNYCISALAMKYQYKFIIFQSYRKEVEICYSKNPVKTLYLAYINKKHYNSVVDEGTASDRAICWG